MQRSIASSLLGHDKYLIEFPARYKSLLASNFDAITKSILLLVPALISGNFPDIKMTNDFRVLHYVELNSAKPRSSGVAKRYLGDNNYTSLSRKQLFFLHVVVTKQECFYIFSLKAGKQEKDFYTLEMAIKNFILQLLDLVAMSKLAYL